MSADVAASPPRHSLAAETVFLRNLLSFKTLELQFFLCKVLRNNSLFAWEMGRGGGYCVLEGGVWCFIQSSLDEMEVVDHASPDAGKYWIHNLLAHFKHLWS